MNISTTAVEICNTLGLSGNYWKILTQTFINLTSSIRSQIYNYINGQISYLETFKSGLVTLSQRGDKISKKINSLTTSLNQVLTPIENILNSIPIQASGLQEIPEISDLLNTITETVPLKIPETTATSISGLAGFDFLEGVNTFRDLKDKIEELGFRASRAASLSNYVEKGSFISDEQIQKLKNILSIITQINQIGL